jgi:ADP-heptose:LPS heptosyltransferase
MKWAGICRLGGVGDNLIAASVLKPLKELGYHTDVISQKPQCVLFENNPYLDKLSVPDCIPHTDQLSWLTWFRHRATEYDRFANLSHTCEIALAFTPIQTQSTWSPQMRRQLANKSYIELAHDVVGVPYTFGRTFFPTEEEVAKAKETIAALTPSKPHVIAWCLSGSRADKIYPHSPQAIARIIKELDCHVVLLGAPPPHRDMALAEQIQEGVRHQNGSLEGLHLAISPDPNNPSWPIRRILTFAQACDLLISPDTGPAWAVAFEPTPKIILLSHASPENITKHWLNTVTLHADQVATPCWPCHLLHTDAQSCIDEQKRCGVTPSTTVTGAACISSINVETIVQHARNLL